MGGQIPNPIQYQTLLDFEWECMINIHQNNISAGWRKYIYTGRANIGYTFGSLIPSFCSSLHLLHT